MLAFALAATTAGAQLVAEGEPVVVEATEVVYGAAVDVAADGAFAVVWYGPFESELPSVSLRRFDAGAEPLGGVLDLGVGVTPDVALTPSGGSVVVWSAVLRARGALLDASGEELAALELPRTPLVDRVGPPSVAVATDGRMVVAWQDYSIFDVGWPRARSFSADGTPAGEPFFGSGTPRRSVGPPDVAFTNEPDFLVVWSGGPFDDTARRIEGQRFVWPGEESGSRFVLSDRTGDYPAVAVEDGGGAAIWSEGDALQARRLAPDGTPVGAQIGPLRDEGTTVSPPAVAADSAGAFVVAWAEDTEDGELGVPVTPRARAFDAAGAPLGASVVLDEGTDIFAYPVDVALAPGGVGVVAWTLLAVAGNEVGVRVQRVRLLAADRIFGDDFESGDLSAWDPPPLRDPGAAGSRR